MTLKAKPRNLSPIMRAFNLISFFISAGLLSACGHSVKTQDVDESASSQNIQENIQEMAPLENIHTLSQAEEVRTVIDRRPEEEKPEFVEELQTAAAPSGKGKNLKRISSTGSSNDLVGENENLALRVFEDENPFGNQEQYSETLDSLLALSECVNAEDAQALPPTADPVLICNPPGLEEGLEQDTAAPAENTESPASAETAGSDENTPSDPCIDNVVDPATGLMRLCEPII